jgi:Na+/H+ antiporter NhaD/arsenite permease-like protein
MNNIGMTGDWPAVTALCIFAIACLVAMASARLDLRRSKPLVAASGLVWMLVAIAFASAGDAHTAARAARAYLAGFAELFLFLLVAMIYSAALEERGVYAVLREQLVAQSRSLRALYWLTGGTAFCVAPLLGSVPTAVATCAMIVAIADDRRFTGVGCVHAVVASNAGGVCSPFGAVSSLVAWQQGAVGFDPLFVLCVPALAAWLVPAAIMGMTVPAQSTARAGRAVLERGALAISGLLMLTLALAWAARELLHLPPVLGMVTGLGLLAVYGSFLRHRELRGRSGADVDLAATALDLDRVLREETLARRAPFDVLAIAQRVDWDTLLYCYGAALCVGGLATLGWAELAAARFYGDGAPAAASALIGLAGGAFDQLVAMLSMLEMSPAMGPQDWLFATLAAGLGGSLLPIGSVAGVAAMNRVRGEYTFATHARWAWAIALGYVAALAVYGLMYGDRMS